MTTKITPPVFHKSEPIQSRDVFQPQHVDHRRTYASNVREITRADGSIVKEFLFENPNSTKTTSSPDVQYEMLDENGNRLPIEGIENLIKMSGGATRQFQQNDGTIVREYFITDPQLVSQVQQKQNSSPRDFHQVENVEVQRPYRFVTSTGRQIDFVLTKIDDAELDEFSPTVTEPLIDWSVLRQQDPDGQIDPEFIRQFINQRYQAELESMSKTIRK